MPTYPDLSGRNMTPAMQDVLADTCSLILKHGFWEMQGTNYFVPGQTYEYAFDLPNLLLQYDFTTLDELDNPPILEYILTIPETTDSDTKEGR